MTETAVRTEPELCLVRYGELALKGGNRSTFEGALQRNIRAALSGFGEARVERRRGRLVVRPERRVEAAARRLQDVFGITSISPAWGVESELEAIVRASRAVLERSLSSLPSDRPIPFRVRATRSEKRFPLNSAELERHVAERILGGIDRIVVDLDEAELTLGLDVRTERTYVFGSRLEGPGGLPVGTLGRGVCLISGGIDSPVAAWLAMKRGLHVCFVTFHSYPWVGEPAKKKVVDLVRILARFQPSSRLYVVPFADVNLSVRDGAPEAWRTVLYRRMMQRIAARVAAREQAGAIVTGESLGQVASQTLENMTTIGAATSLFVVRPLVAYDKRETTELARRIGTLRISEIQEPDCCTVFMPAHPVLRGTPEKCLEIEARYDVEGLAERALAGAEILDLSPEP